MRPAAPRHRVVFLGFADDSGCKRDGRVDCQSDCCFDHEITEIPALPAQVTDSHSTSTWSTITQWPLRRDSRLSEIALWRAPSLQQLIQAGIALHDTCLHTRRVPRPPSICQQLGITSTPVWRSAGAARPRVHHASLIFELSEVTPLRSRARAVRTSWRIRTATGLTVVQPAVRHPAAGCAAAQQERDRGARSR